MNQVKIILLFLFFSTFIKGEFIKSNETEIISILNDAVYSSQDKSLGNSAEERVRKAIDVYKQKFPQTQSYLNDLKVAFVNEDYSVFVNDQTKKAYLAIRGTRPSEVSDLYNDSQMIAGYVPKRLKSINEYINTNFVQYANQGYETIISGHSLGGSIATMACVQNKWISHCEPHNPYFSDDLIDKIVIANGNDTKLKDRLLIQLTSSDFISKLTQENKNKLLAVFSSFDRNKSASQLDNHSNLTLIAKAVLGDDSTFIFDASLMFIIGEKFDQFIKFLKDSLQFIGKATQCNPDSYSEIDTDICSPCPTGYSCQNLVIGPYLCSKGQILNKNQTCVSCPIGTYQSTVGSNNCEKCPDNQVCDEGSEQPKTCGKGTYQSNNTCYKCEPGEYQDQQGQKSCNYCPTGFKCPSVDQSPIPCPPGSYRNSNFGNQSGKGAQFCYSCDKGDYQDESGKTGCKYCPSGSKCPDVTKPPILCPPGQYRNGNFGNQSGEGAQFCYNCSKGNYQTESGQTGCNFCPNGSKCPDVTQSPIPCPPGSYRNDAYGDQSGEGAQFCYSCSTGNYQNESGKTGCYYCPNGSKCPDVTQLPIPCPPGTYRNDFYGDQSGKGAIYCYKCDKGTYQDESGKKGCAYCPKGFTCDDPSKLPVPIQTSALLLSNFLQQQKNI